MHFPVLDSTGVGDSGCMQCHITLPQINQCGQNRSLVRPYGDPSRLISSAKRKSRATIPCREAASCFSVGPPHGTAGCETRSHLPIIGWAGLLSVYNTRNLASRKALVEACKSRIPGARANRGHWNNSMHSPSCGGASHNAHNAAIEGSLQLVCSFQQS